MAIGGLLQLSLGHFLRSFSGGKFSEEASANDLSCCLNWFEDEHWPDLHKEIAAPGLQKNFQKNWKELATFSKTARLSDRAASEEAAKNFKEFQRASDAPHIYLLHKFVCATKKLQISKSI